MYYISTRSTSHTQYNFAEIMRQGIPDDGGLFVPVDIPKMEPEYFNSIKEKSFHEIAFDVARLYIGKDIIDDSALIDIIAKAFNFPLPLIELKNDLAIFELFHGPTGAFKDFGARFMANCLDHIQKQENKKVTIVTATSGDTGAAVASAFHKVTNVEVFILYPKDRVSDFQQKQIAGLADNIHALEIDGSFDDCQDIVKNCFADPKFKQACNLTSSNSVNFSRLIPQIIYYFEAYKQALLKGHSNISFIVPSGNFGNLTGGIYAKKMGLPVIKMVAATNANDVFPNYLKSGIYDPGNKSKKTISNAMDVSNPSNIERIFYIYRSTWNKIAKDINSNSVNDVATKSLIENFYLKDNYLADPHTAVGLSNYYLENLHHSNTYYIVLATAHPFKFDDTIHSILPGIDIPVNDYIKAYMHVKIEKVSLPRDVEAVKNYIKENR